MCILAGIIEPQQRAHSPWLAAGNASESKFDRIPYGRCEALPYGRTFPAACGGELQIPWDRTATAKEFEIDRT